MCRTPPAHALALLALAPLALACGPPVPDVTVLTLAFQRDDARGDELRAVELEILGAVVYLGDAPGEPDPGAACDAQGGIPRVLVTALSVDLTSGGRTTIGVVMLPPLPPEQVEPLHEIRLLARPPGVRSRVERLAAAGRLTCLDGEEERVVLRLQPPEAISLVPNGDHLLVAEFHTRGDVVREGARLLVGQHYPLALEE